MTAPFSPCFPVMRPTFEIRSGSSPLSVAVAPKLCATLSRLRSEEHTSELQSQSNLVCRLLLEKKKLNILCSLRSFSSLLHDSLLFHFVFRIVLCTRLDAVPLIPINCIMFALASLIADVHVSALQHVTWRHWVVWIVTSNTFIGLLCNF